MTVTDTPGTNEATIRTDADGSVARLFGACCETLAVTRAGDDQFVDNHRCANWHRSYYAKDGVQNAAGNRHTYAGQRYFSEASDPEDAGTDSEKQRMLSVSLKQKRCYPKERTANLIAHGPAVPYLVREVVNPSTTYLPLLAFLFGAALSILTQGVRRLWLPAFTSRHSGGQEDRYTARCKA